MNENTDHIGPYELRGELGRGAMARVWRAYDPNLGREVAIKEPLFDPRLPENVIDEMNRRFVKEARTAARLNHSNIVAIYAADIYDGNRPAIVMELVEGATLAGILESAGKLDPSSTLDALDQLLDAVGYAHDRGIVHRDIKPDNIFVNSEGRVKLADFGIAHVEDSGATRATQMGVVLGTPGYMSPEQAKGIPVDSRSDLFSIGVVAYEMLTGENPFGPSDGDTVSLLYRIAHEPAPELPESVSKGLPVDLRPAIMAALSKDPDARPQTAAAFKSMLHGSSPSTYSGTGMPYGDTTTGLAGAAAQSGSTGGKSDVRKWLPYIAVAGAGVILLLVVFFMATSGGGGGGGGGGATGAVQAGGTATTSAVSQSTSSQSGSSGPEPGSSSASAGSAAEEKEYPAPVFDTAIASSELPGDDTTAYYGPRNVLDQSFFTAWNEGAPGPGDWQWIELRSGSPQHVKSVSIAAGYNKSDEVYYNNSRPCDIELSFSDGTIKPAHLEDRRGEYQEIKLDAPVDTTFVRVLILTTYPGSTYEDCCITDIEVK